MIEAASWPSLRVAAVELVEESPSDDTDPTGDLEYVDFVFQITLNDPAATALLLPLRILGCKARSELDGVRPARRDYRVSAMLEVGSFAGDLSQWEWSDADEASYLVKVQRRFSPRSGVAPDRWRQARGTGIEAPA